MQNLGLPNDDFFRQGDILYRKYAIFANKKEIMYMKSMLKITLLAFALAACAPKVNWPDLPLDDVKDVFADATSVETVDTACYNVRQGSEIVGTVLFSSPYSDVVMGYAGATPLRITLDGEGKIKEVKMLDNQESPRFLSHVANQGLFEAWDGMTVAEALQAPVDAVSGATYTSNGVIESLKMRLEAYQRQIKK